MKKRNVIINNDDMKRLEERETFTSDFFKNEEKQ